MNAAFLLVTSACFAGQTPEVVKGPIGHPAPGGAPVVSTVIPGGCGSAGCGSTACCESGGHKLFGGGKLGGLFHRGGSCDGGCNTCSTCGHAHKVWAAPAPTCGCDTCGHGHGGGLFARLRGGHGHASCGCDGGCSAPGCANGACAPSAGAPAPFMGTPVPGAPGGEIINTPPKKMPVPENKTPVTPKRTAAPAPAPTTTFGPAPTIAPSTPVIEVVPPAVPAVPSITNQPRSPF